MSDDCIDTAVYNALEGYRLVLDSNVIDKRRRYRLETFMHQTLQIAGEFHINVQPYSSWFNRYIKDRAKK